MRIFCSKDQLLNSKGEYVQNSLSRITVNEESWERKERERKEEEEERKELERLELFKKQKNNNSWCEEDKHGRSLSQPQGEGRMSHGGQTKTSLPVGGKSGCKKRSPLQEKG